MLPVHHSLINCPQEIAADGRIPGHWFDTTSYVNHLEDQTYGKAGTNPLFADGMAQFNSSLFKTFKFTERKNLQFSLDLFSNFSHLGL